MTTTDAFSSYASALAQTSPDGELQRRLGLYQVFLKLYEHHRELLDEVLSLESSSSKSLAGVTLPYIQGVIAGQDVHLVTNLLQGKTQTILQSQQTWVIGRDPRRVIIPIHDRRLSRCHAAVRYVKDQGFYLIDLGSSNGSFVNGEPIRQAALLKDGDRIRLGSLSFVFFLCQSVRLAESLPAELLEDLENRQPAATQPALSWDVLKSDPDLTAGNRAASAVLDETYMFKRFGRADDRSASECIEN